MPRWRSTGPERLRRTPGSTSPEQDRAGIDLTKLPVSVSYSLEARRGADLKQKTCLTKTAPPPKRHSGTPVTAATASQMESAVWTSGKEDEISRMPSKNLKVFGGNRNGLGKPQEVKSLGSQG